MNSGNVQEITRDLSALDTGLKSYFIVGASDLGFLESCNRRAALTWQHKHLQNVSSPVRDIVAAASYVVGKTTTLYCRQPVVTQVMCMSVSSSRSTFLEESVGIRRQSLELLKSGDEIFALQDKLSRVLPVINRLATQRPILGNN